jgi:hypothetical protein
VRKKCNCKLVCDGCGNGGLRTAKPEAGDDKIWTTAAPNPSSSFIDFELHAPGEQNTDAVLALHIYDMQGREVVKKNTGYNMLFRVDVQGLPSGGYVYEYRDQNGVLSKGKVVIQKQ